MPYSLMTVLRLVVLIFLLVIIIQSIFLCHSNLMVSFPQYHRYIEIAIKQCRSSGIDCKVHGLSIIGRIRAEDEDLATVPFLASDNEEEDDDKAATGRYSIAVVGFICKCCLRTFCIYPVFFEEMLVISNTKLI